MPEIETYSGIKKLTIDSEVVTTAVGRVTATIGDVVNNKTFIDTNGELSTGTLTAYGPREEKTVTAATTTITVEPSLGKYGLSKVTINPTPSEEKTVTMGTIATTVNPTAGRLLSKVTINPISTEEKSVTPGVLQKTVEPTNGKLLSKVTVAAIATQNKTATPSTGSQIITPDEGSFLSAVTVNPIPNQRNSTNVKVEDNTVTIPSGYYASTVTKSVSAGTYTIGVVQTAKDTELNVTSSNVNLSATTSKPSSGFYLTATAQGEVEAYATATINKGYLVSTSATSSTLNRKANKTTLYYSVPTSTCTVTGGEITVSDVTPTITLIKGEENLPSNVKVDSSKDPNYPYYIEIVGSTGKKEVSVSRDEVTKTVTTGYTTASTATVLSSKVATVKVNATNNKTYVQLPAAQCEFTGCTLIAGEGHVEVSGTNISLTATTKPTGYYITATGNGKVQKDEGKNTYTAGYLAEGTEKFESEELESKTSTKHYVISTEAKEISPSTKQQVINPSTNKLLSQVTVKPIKVQEKTITAATTSQTIYPDDGFYVSKITVNAIPVYNKKVRVE